MGRKIDGKTFSSFISFKKKSEAEKTAKRLRDRGSSVRILPNTNKSTKKRFPFTVFTSRQGRKR